MSLPAVKTVRSTWPPTVAAVFLWLATIAPTLAAQKQPSAGYFAPRPLWTASKVIDSPDPPLPYRVEKAYPGLALRQPLCVLAEPGTDSLLIVEHLGNWAGPGRIRRAKDVPDASELTTLLEIDRIIYSIAFHPHYQQNGYLFVGSNGPVSAAQKKTRVSRFTVDRAAPFACDLKSELVILEWDSDGHNGGAIDFGPSDGLLYATSGDGTSDSDTKKTAQNLSMLQGKVLRLDVDRPTAHKPYSIPADNPFIQTSGAVPELWAYGLRNPWRMAFDRQSGALWVGNNGQDLWEQVYLIRRGENYGWSVYEGSHPFYLNNPRGPTPIVNPVAEHSHAEARSLSGGVVYHGKLLPQLSGAYLYGDWATGRIWAIKHDGQKVTWQQELAKTSLQIGGFGLDHAGELIVIDQGGGLYRLRTNATAAASTFPKRLSDTGIFVATDEHRVQPGLIPYSVNAPVWQDGAISERWIGLVGDGRIDFPNRRGWNLPDGSVLVKTLLLEREIDTPSSRRPVETQILTRQSGEWAGYSYAWNTESTDAELVGPAGLDRVLAIRGQGTQLDRQITWRFASRSECMACHSRAANYVLGLSELQMNRSRMYAGGLENQLRHLEQLGVLKVNWLQIEAETQPRFAAYLSQQQNNVRRLAAVPLTTITCAAGGLGANKLSIEKWWSVVSTQIVSPPQIEVSGRLLAIGYAKLKTYLTETPRFVSRLPKQLSEYRRLVDPRDDSESLEARARSYLHANCSHCHVEAGGGNALLELDYTTDLAKMRLLDERPQHGGFSLDEPRLIAPGDADRSVLLYRMSKLGGGRMPRLGCSEVDPTAPTLIRTWIDQLAPGPASTSGTIDRQANRAAWAAMLTSPTASEADLQTAIVGLLSSTSGALTLSGLVDSASLAPGVRQRAVRSGVAHQASEVRDLFERFLPFAERTQRLGNTIDPQAILKLTGSAERGQRLYFETASVLCKSCHRIGTGADRVGPDLSTIGKKLDRAKLLESVLEPSKSIDPKYQGYVLQTTGGKVLSGVLVERTADSVLLRDLQNELVRVPSDEVEQLAPQGTSLMPELQLRDLTAQDVADLLEFLAGQK